MEMPFSLGPTTRTMFDMRHCPIKTIRSRNEGITGLHVERVRVDDLSEWLPLVLQIALPGQIEASPLVAAQANCVAQAQSAGHCSR